MLSITLENVKEYPFQTTIFKRCMKNDSTDYLQNLLLNSTYNNNTADVNIMANNFTETIGTILN